MVDLGLRICFVIGENLRKQALPKNLNAVYSRKTKPNSRFMRPYK